MQSKLPKENYTMNKKKVIIYDMFMVWFMVGWTLVMLAITLPIMIPQTPELVVPTIIVLSSIFVVVIVLTLTIGPRSVLTDETITFCFGIGRLGIKQTYQVGAINRFVVEELNLTGRKKGWRLTICANNTKGAKLGVGNYAFRQLMKRYPTIKVTIKKCFDYQFALSRRTAKYLVKHKKIAQFKCKQLCERFWISKKYLSNDTDSNLDTDE